MKLVLVRATLWGSLFIASAATEMAMGGGLSVRSYISGSHSGHRSKSFDLTKLPSELVGTERRLLEKAHVLPATNEAK